MRLFRICLAFCLGFILTLIPQLSWGLDASDRLIGTANPPVETRNFASLENFVLTQNLSSVNLVMEGKNSYDAGQFAQAVQRWQEANNRLAQAGNFLQQAQVLSFLSLAYQRLGQYPEAREAIAQSQTLINSLSDRDRDFVNVARVYGQVLNTEGRLYYDQGNSEAALDTWKQATDAYEQAEDISGVIFSQINQARALQALGLYRQGTKLLEEIKLSVDEQNDQALKSAVLLTLGDLLREIGSLEQSNIVLQSASAIAHPTISARQKSAILISLGNTATALGNIEEALEFYQQAEQQAETVASVSGTELVKIQAQLNRLSLLIDTLQWQDAETLVKNISVPLRDLHKSRSAVYAQVNLAKHLFCLTEKNPNCLNQENYQIELTKNLFVWHPPFEGGREGDQDSQLSGSGNPEIQPVIEEIIGLLEDAVKAARILTDSRAESYALGNLGEIYQELGEGAIAQQYTELALNIAQSLQASDIAYQWQWQLGRLLATKGEKKQAIAAYSEAVKTLQSLRSDLVATNQEVQFSFRESVEPLYRQLVQLLLTPNFDPNSETSNATETKQISQENLKQARETIESLQLAELDNFFRDACLDAQSQQIDQVDPQAAVIYPIILPEKLAVILSIPGEPLDYYETQLSQGEIETTLGQFQQSLNPAFSNEQRLNLSEQVYDWLIQPAENQLATTGVDTLVFVLDGILRNLPMAALYDGEQYLIEKYSIALTPGLQLLEPSPLQPEKLKVLTGGLTEARQGFSALPAVESELQEIATKVEAEQLLNQEFTEVNLLAELDRVDFPIVHLATHGQFSSNPEETFILTWDNKLQVKEFESLLKVRETGSSNPIELLVLSACQTAAGDERAGLGLAGVAVRSGARSTLATLWSVNDQSTANLVADFYRYLLADKNSFKVDETNIRMTKAKALQMAQLTLLQNPNFKHPFYWAPFVLVGNWL